MIPYLILIMLFVGIIGELIIRIFDIEVTLELLFFSYFYSQFIYS